MSSHSSKYLRTARRELPDDLAARQRPVITVNAPAGYGKSTLLEAWRKGFVALDRQVVSLVVDPDDRDGDRLTLDLLHAFSPADARRSQMLMGGVGEHGKRAVIMALLAEFSSLAQPTVLFIDDVHWLGETAAAATLRLLITHQPERMTLVLSGRSNLAMFASEALLEGRIVSYGRAQLAFNADDIAEMLRQHGVEPKATSVERIMERTQGWPAAVRLIAMTVQDNEERQDSVLQGLMERRQPLTEYLSDILLARLPIRSAQFLLGISLLRRFSIPLAAATTGMDDAGQLLEDLEWRALPLSPSGDVNLPYALHPLVREFLLVRLRRGDSELLAKFTTSALDWLMANQRTDAAIDLSLDVGDVSGAAQLIDRFSRTAARHYGRHATFLYWCNKVPQGQLSKFPQIQVVRMWSLNVTRRYREADQILAELESAGAQDAAPQTLEPTADRHGIAELIELERCVQLTLRDRWEHLATKVRNWQARWPRPDSLHHGMAYTMIGCGELAASNFDSAIDNLRIAHRLLDECQCHYILAWVNMWTASALTKQGHYRQALATCDETVSLIAAHLGGQTPAEIMLHAQRGFLLYELNRTDEAGAALESGLTALTEQSSIDSLIMGHVALARLQNARRMHLDALETLAEGEHLGWSQDLPRLAIALAGERIDLLLRQGEAGQASALWKRLQRDVEHRSSGSCELAMRDKTHRIEARLALVQGAYAAAHALIEPALCQATKTGQMRKQVELLLVQALALQGAHEKEQSQRLLKRAVDIALPQGFVRVFADEGPAMRTLLSTFVESRRDADPHTAMSQYLGVLTEALQIEKPRAAGDASVVSASTLTRREVRILGMLQSGLSNRELAAALFVSEGTIKWHLKNIYSKLGVPSRVAAISVGRESGLLH